MTGGGTMLRIKCGWTTLIHQRARFSVV